VSDPDIVVRLHDGPGGVALWALNPTRTDRRVTVTVRDGVGADARLRVHRGAVRQGEGGVLEIDVPARDAVVVMTGARSER
jgi:hypothetical protein